MAKLVLIDTSMWTRFLRRDTPDSEARDRVQFLVKSGLAAWCVMVQLELWAGANNDGERERLLEFDRTIKLLPITAEAWAFAVNVASVAARAGYRIPSTDVIIFSCARLNGVPLEHRDRHYPMLESLLPG